MNVTVVQRNITQKLSKFSGVPDYIAHLAHILTTTQEEVRVRTIAGDLLQKNSRLILNATPEVVAYVKVAVLQAFTDSTVMIRNTAGRGIVVFLGVLEPRNWLECLQQLVNSLDSEDVEHQEAAFNVLEKTCEDYPRQLDAIFRPRGGRPLDLMISKFLALTEHPSARMRAHAVACLSYLVPVKCRSLFVHIDAFIVALSKRNLDEDPQVRRHVCQALVLLLAACPEKLMPEMTNFTEYMLSSTKDKNKKVALEACKFWFNFVEDAHLTEYLHPLLGRVAPVLLDCMVFGDDDLLWLEGDAEDAAVPDKGTDIKPRHCGGKSHGLEREESGAPAGEEAQAGAKGRVGAYGEETHDLDDDFAEELSTYCSLRTHAATAFTVVADRFGADLLNVLLGPIKEKLSSNNWRQRESGILALGAMSEGCIGAIEAYLSTLVPYLIYTLNDPERLVRSMTCRTLGRYASWICRSLTETHMIQYFVPTMEGLLLMVIDNDKRVQEAGCSAFITLAEEAGMELVPYLAVVLRILVLAFERYQHENMRFWYEAVGTLGNTVGRQLSNPVYVDILMPSLATRWSQLKDDDKDLIPLLECLAYMTIDMGPSFAPYAGPIFERCSNIIQKLLPEYQQNPELEEPFFVRALQLLSGLTQGLGMALEPFLSQSQLVQLVTLCLKLPQALARQSAYELIGELAMSCFTILRPHMPAIMPGLMLQLDLEPEFGFVNTSKNATWSIGEVALRYGRDDQEFQQWVNPLIARLIPILLHPKAPPTLHKNAVVLIGIIGLVHPDLVAPHLPQFAQVWCESVHGVWDDKEKDTAFRGFCTLVQTNPAGISKSLLWFCDAIVRWTQLSAVLDHMFRRLLQGLKGNEVIEWAAQVPQFPPVIQERLAARYGV
ncbi:hypothetical protein PC9H_010295 [Pleurotus ostreatus]|uniref:Uncharacterized protein n=1 Tax=Pleurotus ostreatus TaxID=5322 RepID=A0A8H6ZR88_PLEOS|nr:uncharacterized protein PC9H_010295 [Pleurotus ostreatus]KAF7424984.1 hypothetical protein PC9H_010295 [Pleurotus ostreatus]